MLHVDSTILTSIYEYGLLNGTYYYVITAVNSSGESIISNCENITVSIYEFRSEVDDHTIIYCDFENTLTSYTSLTGITNGNWKYTSTNNLQLLIAS